MTEEEYKSKCDEILDLLRQLLNAGNDALKLAESKEKHEIHAGDVLMNQEGHTLMVLHVDNDFEFLVYDGYYKSAYGHNVLREGNLKKTGRVFPSVAAALKTIEDDNESS